MSYSYLEISNTNEELCSTFIQHQMSKFKIRKIWIYFESSSFLSYALISHTASMGYYVTCAGCLCVHLQFHHLTFIPATKQYLALLGLAIYASFVK